MVGAGDVIADGFRRMAAEKYGARVLDNAAPMHVTPPDGDGEWKVEAL